MSGKVNVWSKVGVAVQTVLAATVAMASVTKANPAVVGSVAHGYADGDIVLLQVEGMTQLNNRIARVDNKATDTFELEGIDSTLYDTFTSGTAQKITFGAVASTFTDVDASGGEAADIDIGTIHEDEDRVIPGNKSALKYSFPGLWKPSDAALLELVKASDAKTARAVQITFATGDKVYFYAYPSATLAPIGSKGQAATTPASFSVAGKLTVYAAA